MLKLLLLAGGGIFLFFGRAGAEHPIPGIFLFRGVGAYSNRWSSVASTAEYGYFLDLYASEANPSGSNFRTFGFSLRCLVNSPVGGGGKATAKDETD